MSKFVYFVCYTRDHTGFPPSTKKLTKEEYDRIRGKYLDLMSMMPVTQPDNVMGYEIAVCGDWCDILLIKRKVG